MNSRGGYPRSGSTCGLMCRTIHSGPDAATYVTGGMCSTSARKSISRLSTEPIFLGGRHFMTHESTGRNGRSGRTIRRNGPLAGASRSFGVARRPNDSSPSCEPAMSGRSSELIRGLLVHGREIGRRGRTAFVGFQEAMCSRGADRSGRERWLRPFRVWAPSCPVVRPPLPPRIDVVGDAPCFRPHLGHLVACKPSLAHALLQDLVVLQAPRPIDRHHDVELQVLSVVAGRSPSERLLEIDYQPAKSRFGPDQKTQTAYASPGRCSIKTPWDSHEACLCQGWRPSAVGQSPGGNRRGAPSAM